MADHPHTIDRWDDATGQNMVEQIAAGGDYLIALETYRAAVKRWPKDKITLRNRARVIEAELGGLGRCSLHRSIALGENGSTDSHYRNGFARIDEIAGIASHPSDG